MARILRARDFGNVVTLSSDEGKGDPVQKFLIYFYITKSILISQNALDFVISLIRFCDIKNRICYSKNQANFVILFKCSRGTQLFPGGGGSNCLLI